MTRTARIAPEPFQFFTLAHVTRTGSQTASTVRELLNGLESCSDESIYHHMVRGLGNEESLNGSSPNDFAKWLDGVANCGGLSEQVAALDERYYSSIEEMRNDLWRTINAYLAAYPECGEQVAAAPFIFCEGLDLSVPLDQTARTLDEFRARIQTMSNETFYLHFVASNARLELQSNDFSIWLADKLGMDELARKINEIDLTQVSLGAARENILQLIDALPERHQ
jgi:Family of unknown function (DUF5752)